MIAPSVGIAGNTVSRKRPVAKISIPILPKIPACMRSTRYPARGAVNKVATGQGVSNKPVATSVRPNVFCKKNGRDTKASIWAVNEQIDVHTDREKIGIFDKSTGNNGKS